MLSNTADTNPRPSAVVHDADGSFSTGISDAHTMSESRKTLPLAAAGRSDQAGRRHSAAMKIATHTPAPMNGKRSDHWLNLTLTTIAVTRMNATIATRGQSTRTPAAVSRVIGE